MEISLAMLVKNEEGMLGRCLESFSPIADEIVILDTGSTDATKEVAAGFDKVEVYDSERFDSDTHYSEFNFGAARNESLSYCTKPWIVWADADDVLADDAAEKIREIAESAPNFVCGFAIHFGGYIFEHHRMFPNFRGVYFDEVRSCHENIVLGDGIGYFRLHDIEIHHFPGKKRLPSAARNITLLERDHFERGLNDNRTLFYLANSYKDSGRLADAVKVYEMHQEKADWVEERFFSFYYTAKCFFQMEDWQNAQKAAFAALAENKNYAEAYCLLGDIYLQRSMPDEAQSWYLMAEKMDVPENAKLLVNPHLYSGYPATMAMKCRASKPKKGLKQAPDKMFVLPDGHSDSLMALAALCEWQRRNPSQNAEICVLTDFQARMVKSTGFTVADDCDAKETVNMAICGEGEGGHRILDFCHQIGIEPEGVPLANMHGAGATECFVLERSPYIVIQAESDSPDRLGVHKWKIVSTYAAELGYKTIWIGNDAPPDTWAIGTSFDMMLASVISCKLFIGVNGIGHHLAAFLGKPAIVLWGEECPELSGYSYQENVCASGNIEKISPRSIVGAMERSLIWKINLLIAQ